MFEHDFLTSSAESKDVYRQLISRASEIVATSLPSQPYSGKSPAQLKNLLENDFLPTCESSLEHLAGILRTVVEQSINVNHPQTAAHLHCPPLLASLAGEVVISALNQSMDSFDQAPIATIVEQQMVQWLCRECGFPAGADGTFTTGGSQSNYMGLLLARDAFVQKRWNRSVQKEGLPPEARQLRILCSDVAHFTVEKSAAQLGLGTDAVVRVETDDRFRMKPSALRSALDALNSQSLFPMAVVATAGTTDFGSIDPIPELAELAHSANAWLHVDAAYGGALLFSQQHREKLAGIERADSLSIDFHKLLWQPIPCSVFLLRDFSNFEFLKMHADYLNPEAHEDEGIPNLVTTSLLTSRRFDALKLWISFQSLGREKLAAMIDRTVTLANYAAQVVQNSPRLELTCEPQLSTVVFRYLPSGKDKDADQTNLAIKRNLFNSGVGIIGQTQVRNNICLKFTCLNPATSEEQMDELVREVESQGRDLESGAHAG